MNLDKTHVLITGGTDGIGLALATELLAHGARVTVCGRGEARLQKARETLGSDACVLQCDVSDPAAHAGLLAAARTRHGPLDVLVNNAAAQQLMDFLDEGQVRHISREVATNLTAPLLLTEAVLPELRKRPHSAIVQITSGLALSPKASSPVYCATKAALRSFSRTLRWQLEATSVRVVEVLPPIVDTAMTAGRGSRKLAPRAVAVDIVRALHGGDTEVFVGKVGLLRWLVALAPWLAARVTRRM